MTFSRRAVLAGAAIAGASACQSAPAPSTALPPTPGWVAGWGTSLQADPVAETLPAGASAGRSIVSTLSGDELRVSVSNAFGETPLRLLEVRASGTPLSFAGARGVVIPAGAVVISDPLQARVAAGEAIELSFTLAAPFAATNVERTAGRDGGWVQTLGGARASAMPMVFHTLEVRSSGSAPVLVIIGDTKSAGADTWPTYFADLANGRMGVVNRSVFAGLLALGAPRLNALARFEDDALATSGASHVMIFAGNNDLIQPGMRSSRGTIMMPESEALSAGQLTALLHQAAMRARDAGLIPVGAPWLPYDGVEIEGYSTPEKQEKRDAVNAWIRGGGAFDTIVDFDAALRDADAPGRLQAGFDSGNHFTPNAAGYEAMAREAARVLLT